jgi:hypothetical protein
LFFSRTTSFTSSAMLEVGTYRVVNRQRDKLVL